MATEGAIKVQADTLSDAGSVRTVPVVTLINGVPTVVQMQVVALSDANGVLFDTASDAELLRSIHEDIHELRKLFALFMGIPVIDDSKDEKNSSGL